MMLTATRQPLSHLLRDATAAAHGYAEKSPFMSRLVAGSLTRAAVADYTAQLWFIYRALEEGVRANGDGPFLSAVADQRLERVYALEADLVELIGPEWREEIVPGPGTAAFVELLTGLSDTGDDLALLAHHYVRYLGDLSGGQVIARMLRDRYGVTDAGVNFYRFNDIGKIKPYRDGYRSALDGLELTDEQSAHLVAAAQEAFAANGRVFQDLADRHCSVSDRF
ncbi:biliverdin-producing heme oxygenase [Corynebacterium testudinoris]|uniref:Heme oxygenase n=1 Tax=Corynebacterium testudinoris TaxID=136857 RepID=A0A0G3H8P9_9CORY|nr:biliverdin-producing heme oxygenase [Corynebacterium testudinoris]AKK07547.1 heme oxygenase [Corynebacterium testudinoris]